MTGDSRFGARPDRGMIRRVRAGTRMPPPTYDRTPPSSPEIASSPVPARSIGFAHDRSVVRPTEVDPPTSHESSEGSTQDAAANPRAVSRFATCEEAPASKPKLTAPDSTEMADGWPSVEARLFPGSASFEVNTRADAGSTATVVVEEPYEVALVAAAAFA